VLRQLCM